MLSSQAVLAALVLLLGVLALAAPFHILLLVRFPLVMVGEGSQLGGVLFDAKDLVLAFLVLAFLLRNNREAGVDRLNLPSLLPWFALGVLLSLSYLSAPGSQEYLTGPLHIGYQVYRYAWKVILFYALGLLLLNGRIRLERALLAIVVSGDLVALQATLQGYAGGEAPGPFATGNQLGGALVAPLLLSTIGFLVPQTRARMFWLASSLLMFRALLFSGSRGATIAVVAGICFCGAWYMTLRTGRARLARLAPAGVLAVALVSWLKPDVLERPTVRHALTSRQGLDASTMQWRMQERWPHFVERILRNPWLGVGTDVDPALASPSSGGGGATPHNGYLSVAAANGVPAAALYVVFALFAVRNGVGVFVRSKDLGTATVGLLLAAAVVGILVHNLGESTLRDAFVGDLFWTICAMSSCAARFGSGE